VRILPIWFFILIFLHSNISLGDDEFILIEISIKDHKFVPEEIKAPTNKKIKIVVHNLDDTIEEFESTDFNREKIVPPHKKVNILLAPLKSGKYTFYGEFHQDTAKGTLIVE